VVRGARTFEAPAETYDRHVGRYTPALARAHLRLLDLARRSDVLEVGSGPGALTEVLVEAVGASHVCAVDPSEPFVEECRRRVPEADVRVGGAEDLPDFGREFAAATSQLVLNFMSDADAGVAAMRRSVKPGGVVASVVWDYRAGMRMLRVFWDAALELDRDAPDEGRTMAHCTPAALRALWLRAGLGRVQTGELVVQARYGDFEDFWAPFPTGIAPSGAYCASLDDAHREALRALVVRRLGAPGGPFVLDARAWYVRGATRRRSRQATS
jgi:SAM-dependent methyltransferase